MRGMFGTRIMSENQLLDGYANGITPNLLLTLVQKIAPLQVIEIQNNMYITCHKYLLNLGQENKITTVW
jgi:hypothetical protein